jgi:hypothetical protein
MAILVNTEELDGRALTIQVEVDDPEEAGGWGGTREGRAQRVLESTRDVFGDGLDLAGACAARTVKSIEQTAEEIRPNEFEVQLAIKFDAEAGAVLAKVAAGAQMQVTMRWKRPTST